ncbi:hypothetical protein CEXT_276111 [Caerostris extrusa]|uniref:Uncharacterized protein n=1 Tax=Caerostris extrusa TaxID=172846 RepID=A0AAV4WR70_CAEEX|nr:hypothetical protein CEXT_276111 [Caerostris extrusa]
MGTDGKGKQNDLLSRPSMISASSASVLCVPGRKGGGVIGYRISDSATQSHTTGGIAGKPLYPGSKND